MGLVLPLPPALLKTPASWARPVPGLPPPPAQGAQPPHGGAEAGVPGGRAAPAQPAPPGVREAGDSFVPVLYLCTLGSWGSVSQVSCSSCCRRSPASAAACPSPCPGPPRRLPPPTAASRWAAAAGCLRCDPRRQPLARYCCPPRRRGIGSGCAGCPAGAGTGRSLGLAEAAGWSPPHLPRRRYRGPRPCRRRQWGTRRRRASSSVAGAGGGKGGSARSWTRRT